MSSQSDSELIDGSGFGDTNIPLEYPSTSDPNFAYFENQPSKILSHQKSVTAFSKKHSTGRFNILLVVILALLFTSVDCQYNCSAIEGTN
jgi:hypothetical protein